MVLMDCHVHLDNKELDDFVASQDACPKDFRIKMISNSVDVDSSRRNLKLAKTLDNVIPFVGIHPEVFLNPQYADVSLEFLNEQLQCIFELIQGSSGIGEIGLDQKYGAFEKQVHVFERQLEAAEKWEKPISLHSRGEVPKIIEILSTVKLVKGVLFHWFAGTESELHKLMNLGYFVSFGPTILNSKSRAGLLKGADPELFLAETDSPLHFGSAFREVPITPFAITSILFSMALKLQMRYDDIVVVNEQNAKRFLG